MSDKNHLKQTMLSLTAEQLRFAEGAYAQYLAGAAGRGDEPGDADASSQAFNSGLLAASFECPIHTYEEALAALRRIDFESKDEVGEGAAVKIDGRWFVVGVATSAFQCDGKTYMGISPQAPIYAALAGLGSGDTAEFNGRTIKIEDVR
ncbi:GreA/GreB family elongation factor (plasmid) [Aquincola tertiaricarbonis]|jgi:hypothetical protein|uniref:GreA/GreB family elongation factor n=1 Tax=Aquincola tertiaricarbonis TaxID=391953 RepID=A0ABY4SJR9_AQUTE|nr:GreA/GreB family elongation factor [Aquincola tertiaricarbonis]URI12078.1 GreA/GreB family elongation factor [Aquincola tertiaricarbonis]